MMISTFLSSDRPPSQFDMPTSFYDRGSIDGTARGICDGDNKYTVSSSGIIQYGKIYLELCDNAIFSDLITTLLRMALMHPAQISSTRWRTALPSNFSPL